MKTADRPLLEVIGPTGANLVPRWGDALLGVTITDNAGHESDECTIKLSWKAPWSSRPPKGARYVVSAGWTETGLVTLGTYTLQRTRRSGSPEDGETIEIVCRSADMVDKMKAVDTRHYDAETGHGTVGGIFEDLGKEAGVAALVDPAVAGIAMPYRLRWRQSAIDFASELADEVGAVAKPQGGKLVVTARGGARSGSGRALPPILIERAPGYSYEVEDEPRGDYKSVDAPWFDDDSGRPDAESFESAAEASAGGLVHAAPSKEEAQRQAGAASDAYARSSATGSFEMRGRPDAVAGAPVTCSGFGEGVDEVDWRAATVTHEINPDDGWLTTVEVEVRDKPKEASKGS